MSRLVASAVRTAALAICLLFVAVPAMAAPTFPSLEGRRVVDEAHILPADLQAAISAKLEALEAKTTDQFEVVTVPSLQGYDIQDYGYQLGRAWGIGQKGKDNGVILLVAPNEKKVRIEVGYKLEPVITDALSSVIIQSRILPKFKAGDLPGGVSDGVDAVIDQLSLDPAVAESKAKAAAVQVTTHRSRGGLPFPAIIVMIIVFLLLSRVMRGGLWPLLFLSSMGSGRGGWGGGGGGWGGGGGGGFSGGGGSFGGGGASGSW